MDRDNRICEIYRFARLPEGHWDCTLSGVPDEPYKAIIEDWVTNIKDKIGGRGLYAYGPFGRGKSGSATIIAKAALANGIFSFWLNFRDLHNYSINEDQNMFDANNTIMERIKSVELLIVDEFEAKANKKWVIEVLENIVRHRHYNGLTTIITSNTSPQKMEKGELEPLTAGFRAIGEEAFEYVLVKGKNLRKK